MSDFASACPFGTWQGVSAIGTWRVSHQLTPALKQGHATRPIPVVQKKSMSGIGKDRDEAIPFWDQ